MQPCNSPQHCTFLSIVPLSNCSSNLHGCLVISYSALVVPVLLQETRRERDRRRSGRTVQSDGQLPERTRSEHRERRSGQHSEAEQCVGKRAEDGHFTHLRQHVRAVHVEGHPDPLRYSVPERGHQLRRLLLLQLLRARQKQLSHVSARCRLCLSPRLKMESIIGIASQ